MSYGSVLKSKRFCLLVLWLVVIIPGCLYIISVTSNRRFSYGHIHTGFAGYENVVAVNDGDGVYISNRELIDGNDKNGRYDNNNNNGDDINKSKQDSDLMKNSYDNNIRNIEDEIDPNTENDSELVEYGIHPNSDKNDDEGVIKNGQVDVYVSDSGEKGSRNIGFVPARPSNHPVYDDEKNQSDKKSVEPARLNKYVPTYQEILDRILSEPDKFGLQRVHYSYWAVDWTIRHSGMVPKSLYAQPPNEYPEQRLPKVILIGAGKCGTRALLEFLSMHPHIVTAKNEVHFFDLNIDKGMQWYLLQMPLSFSNQLTMEKSPSYLWSDQAVEAIYKMDKDIKLLVILKNPVDRVVSQAIRNSQENITNSFLRENAEGQMEVNDKTNTVKWSIYVTYLRKWIQRFSLHQIHIVESTEFGKDPAGEIKKIEKFLKIPSRITEDNFYFNDTKGFQCMKPLQLNGQIVCLSEGKGRQHPKLEPSTEKLLHDFYLPYNEELFTLLGRRFAWGQGEGNEEKEEGLDG